MTDGEQSCSDGRLDGPVRLAIAVGTLVGASIALLWRPVLGWPWPDGFWPGMIGFGIFTGAGGVLGRLVGGLLFRPSSGGPT